MPKPAQHALIWSEEYQHYELQSHGQPQQYFPPDDASAFSRWLTQHTAFVFVGKAGRLSVLKEARPRGTGYWYAYRTKRRHSHKRYLGRTDKVTFARLELVAQTLTSSPGSAPLAPVHETRSPSTLRAEPGQEMAWTYTWCEGGQRTALLSSKLSPPRLPLSLVSRARLLKDLEAVLSHRLTLVSASAGSGKTTLLSAWAATISNPRDSQERAQAAEQRVAERAVAWLSLDALDNDPIRFWTSVIAALRTCLPTLGELARGMLHSPQSPSLSIILTALLNEIMEVGRDLILILDDYHVIEDQTTHESLLFLLDHLPDTLHLVLATRTDPNLPLSQLRVRGQLIEIDTDDLRFTREETACFLRERMGLPLSEEDVAILETRTEGWIAGLQLAALSLRKRQDLSASVKGFAGSHRYLLDYVQQDLLAHLPISLQDFLLQTSILTRMNAALCQTVTVLPSQQESQEMLEALEQANLFVVPLDSRRQWYRYHDLFREALLARLQASQPELVHLLHMRAACWYKTAGSWQEAIAHALAAPDYHLAASLMEQAAPAFWLTGEAMVVHTWVLCLPDAILRAHIRLALSATFRVLNSIAVSTKTMYASLVAQMQRTFTRMEEILRNHQQLMLGEAEVILIRRRLRLLRALIEARTILQSGNLELLRLLTQELEALSPDEEEIWNIIPLSFTYWLTMTLQSEATSMIPRLLSAKQQMMQAGEYLATMRVMIWLAFSYIQAGQLHQAQQESLEALTLVERLGGRTAIAGHLHHYLFNIYYAWNWLEEASEELHHLLQIAYDWQQVDLRVMGESAFVQLSLAKGDTSTAQQAFQRMESMFVQERFANQDLWGGDARMRLWLAQGNLAEASNWAAQTTFHPDAWNPLRKGEVLMLVRVSLAQQQYSSAVETLSRFSRYLDQPADISTTIEYLTLYVVALHHAGKREQARHVAARLLALTEAGGFIRVYLDAGTLMQQVLQTLLETPSDNRPDAVTTMPPECPGEALEVAISRPYVSRLLATFEQERSSAQRSGTPRDHRQEIPPHPQHAESRLEGVEPLSPQELKVLRLLVAGQTYAQMAQALVVSPNTIKTQVSTIYRKLGVSRRIEAITQARRFQLL